MHGGSLIAFAQRCEARSLVGTDPLGGVRKIYPGAPILGLLSCMCGPSKSQPCDGSHKATRDEEEARLTNTTHKSIDAKYKAYPFRCESALCRLYQLGAV